MIELGQYDYIYTIIPPGDDDTPEIDDRGAAYEVKGVYGSDIGVTSTEKNSAFKGTFDECEKGNWSYSPLYYNDGESPKYTISVGYDPAIEAETATSIGEIDGTTVYEVGLQSGYAYKLVKEIETTISSFGATWDIPATAYLTIYVTSAEQLQFEDVAPLLASVTYIDPQKITVGGKNIPRSSQEFSTQWGKYIRAGVEVTIDEVLNKAQYFGETISQKNYYYGKLTNYTFTPYIDMRFLSDYELAFIVNNQAQEASVWVIGQTADSADINQEIPAQETRCFPTDADPSQTYASLDIYDGEDPNTAVLLESIGLTTTLTEDQVVDVNPE